MKQLLLLIVLAGCHKDPVEPCVPSETVTVDTVAKTFTIEGTVCEGQPLPGVFR